MSKEILEKLREVYEDDTPTVTPKQVYEQIHPTYLEPTPKDLQDKIDGEIAGTKGPKHG